MGEKFKFLLFFLLWATLAFLVWLRLESFLVFVISRPLPFLLSLSDLGTDILSITHGTLNLRAYAMRADLEIDAGSVVINLVPLMGLFLATRGRGWVGRLTALALAVPIVLGFDALALYVLVVFTEAYSTSIGALKVFLDGVGLAMVPLLLWALLLQPMSSKKST